MLRVIFCANGHANVLIRWKKHVLCVLDKKCSHSLHKNGEKRHFFNASHVTLKTDCFIIIITSSIFGIGKIPARMYVVRLVYMCFPFKKLRKISISKNSIFLHFLRFSRFSSAWRKFGAQTPRCFGFRRHLSVGCSRVVEWCCFVAIGTAKMYFCTVLNDL